MFWKKESTAANITPLTVTLNASDEGNHQYNLLQTVDHDFNEKTASSGRASKLSRLQSAEQTVRPVDPCSTAQRRFFTSDGLSIARTRNLTILGKAEGPRFRPSPAMAAHIPAKTSAFKLLANFSKYSAGHYVVLWRVKALSDFKIPNGLHFVVNVSYEAEPDVTGTLDLIMPAHKLSILAKDTWYDLVLEEKLVIQPHLGSAQVQAVLCNNENVDREEFSGFVIDCVEIRPMAMKIERQDGVSNFYVPRAATPNFIIDTPQLHLKSVDSTCPPAPAPVTKLASSRNSQFLASLSLSKNEAFITIWDMGVIRNPSNPSRNIGKLYKASASAVVYHRGVGDLSIGLSLSTSGDQVAIFQEPKIGEWADGSEVERAVFPFRLFNNPLVPQRSVIVDINTPPNRNMPKNMNTSANNDYDWGNTLASTDSSSENMELQEVRMDLEILHTFIGFGEFLPETRKSDWEKNDVNSALLSSGEGEGTEDNNEDSKEFGVKNIVSQPSTMFAACNGLYLDVFEISADKKWQRLHTITLSDLQPTLSRRITCKMMMEVISSNTFMWLEDDGRSCTIWNLLTGSNITHISSIENAKFKGPTFRGHSKMAISPHESIVALASVDGSLTTYFANTGMAIDDRKFPGYKVEHVGFHAQDDQLFVILRNSATSELSARVLDTLQLKSEIIVNQVPIPTIGSAILAFFYTKGFWNRGIICETDGPLIRCYVTYQPMSSKIIKSNESVLKAEPEDVVYESSLPGEDHIQYRLMTGIHRELLPEGDGVAYWVLRVEVIEENTLLKTQKIIFSFVPEPWMRVTTTEVVHPENLQSTFFVPCGTRFAVVGMQTLQIWNLPTRENNKCSLQFIWSQPRDEKDLGPGGVAFRSTRVRDYYLDTSSTNVYLDTETGNTVAEIKLNDKFRKKSVTIPGPGTIGARYAILFCFRSIHLLAAAYAFSYQESKKSTRETPQVSFTYEDHAEAIVRFTREHINRMMSVGIYSPKKRPPYNNNNSNASSTQQQNNSIRNNSNHSDTPALPHNGIQFVDTPASTTKSAVSEPEAIAMGDNVIHTGTNGRGKDDSDNDNNDRLYRRSNPLNRHHNKPTSKPSVSGSSKLDVVTVLTLLLDHPYLQCTNHIFVEGLLNTDNGDWIPRDNKVLNPIKRAIEAKNGPLVEAFIEYCIKNAKKYHPAYLMPAVQCLNELSDRYPKILVDMFRKASYVPAHNHNYVSSHALIANPQYKQWLLAKLKFWNMFSSKKWEKSNIINDYERPVFSLRSQLPFRASSFMNILNIETSVRDERAKKFPPKQDVGAEEKKQMQSPYSHKIYVAPFPKLSMYGPYRPWFRDATESAKSAFTDIAGRDFFDSPAMVATLDFKWHKFGFFYWFLRFLVVLTFFILVVVITAQQIRVMSIDEPVRLTAEDIEIRYMNSWRPVFKATIVVGCLLAGYEVIQFLDAPKKYYKSPYNYMDLAAYVAPVIGCILFLRDTPNGKPDDGGPDQIWIMSFSILALYINILFELRVIKQLGIVVNIILNITRRIIWFFLIFGLFLVSFTHALLHLLHTRPYNPECLEQECDHGYLDGFPKDFASALATTYFFLAGRYDPIETSFEKEAASFQIMMIIFFFFTAILLLNILIALMNDAFNESKSEGQLAWLKQWSEVIAEVEVYLMTQGARQNRNYFPDYIYYGASEQEAELYESKFCIANKSNLSIENRFLVETVTSEQNSSQLAQRAILRDVQALSKDLEKVKLIQEGLNHEMTKLTEVVAVVFAQATAIVGEGSSEPMSQVSPIEQDPPASGASPVSGSDNNTPFASPIGSAPGTPKSPLFQGGVLRPSPGAAAAAQRRHSSIGRPPAIAGSMRRKTSTPAPYTGLPMTPHCNSPQDSIDDAIVPGSVSEKGPLGGSGDSSISRPSTTYDSAGPSSSSSVSAPVPPSLPAEPYKAGDIAADEGQSRKDRQLSLKRRLQRKLAAVQTMDDALKARNLQLEENNASHPMYVIPQSRHGIDADLLCDSVDEVREATAIAPVHHSSTFHPSTSDHQRQHQRQYLHQHHHSGSPEHVRKTQSEIMTSLRPREFVPLHLRLQESPQEHSD